MTDLEGYAQRYARQYVDGSFETVLVGVRRRHVIHWLERYGPRRILEVGCGLEPLFGQFERFDAWHIIEPVPEFARRARELAVGDARVEVLEGYIEEQASGLPWNEFDFIVVSGLVHEVPDPLRLLAAVRSLCSKATVVHFNVPNVLSFHRLLALEMGLIDDVFERSTMDQAFGRHTRFDRERFTRLLAGRAALGLRRRPASAPPRAVRLRLAYRPRPTHGRVRDASRRQPRSSSLRGSARSARVYPQVLSPRCPKWSPNVCARPGALLRLLTGGLSRFRSVTEIMPPAVAEPNLGTIEESREALIGEINQSAGLSLVLCGGLISDQLGLAGARALLRDVPHRELGLDDLGGERGETALLLGLGLTRLDHGAMPRAIALAELRFTRVIVLPTSIDPSEDSVRDALVRTSATVFASDPDSYREIAGLCDARLAHDCSFFFDFTPYARPGEGVLDAFRANRTGPTAPSRPSGNDDISVSAPDLDMWLGQIAAHDVVRTDRAHVMIAAALMGKQVQYVVDSEIGVESIARHALADRQVGLMAPPATQEALTPATLDDGTEATLARLSSAALATPPPAPATSTVRVTAVVLTRDRPELLLRTLASLERSQAPLRTLVIDNNSAPAAAQALAVVCERRPDTELKRSERNLGCAGGRRRGAELADTEFVLFLDDDAELMPGALEHLLSELDRHPHAGAVTATVVGPDGTVLHSGGSMNVSDEIVTFELLGDGVQFTDADLPPSGSSGWAPGTAMLARATLLAEFPVDAMMGPYFEDNEWCYRISRVRADSFRRSREALVVHHFQPKHAPSSDFVSRSRTVELLVSYARFYQLHGRLLGPWLFDHVPGMRAEDGSCDLAAAKLLMELVIAKGTDWIFTEWMRGDLEGLLSHRRRQAAEAAVARLKARAAHDASTIAALDARLNDATRRLRRIEESVTWQAFERVRARTFKLLGGEQSRGVRMLQGGLRLLGRTLLRGSRHHPLEENGS